METGKIKRISIYDPNRLNPYGVELAAVIGGSGHRVDLWCTENRKTAPHNVKVHAKLTGSRGSRPFGSIVLRRLLAPLLVVLTASRRSPLILVWTRDPWDALIFGIRAILGGKTITVYHNPIATRARPGLSGIMEKFVLRVSRVCVVHSARLANAAEIPPKKLRIAAHPPYAFTAQLSRLGTLAKIHSNAVPIVAFLGALRTDKGSGDLVSIAKQTNIAWILRVLGPDRLPSSTEALLNANGVMCEYVGSGGGPSDDELVEGLLEADVMIAPYRSVTESGSIHMALSLRVPVLAYESSGISHIVNEDSMAASPHSFGYMLERYLENPWPTYTSRATQQHDQCRQDWRAILDEC